jgi:hypothetical protein
MLSEVTLHNYCNILKLLYGVQLTRVGLKLTTLVVIGNTDCTGRCKTTIRSRHDGPCLIEIDFRQN